MKNILLKIMLVFSLLFTSATAFHWAQLQAVWVNTISNISDLRNERNMEECLQVEGHVSRSFRKLSDEMRLPFGLGCLAILTSLAGLFVEPRRKQKALTGVD